MSSDAEQSRERYYWYKARGICVRCGQANAVKGQTMCQGCKDSRMNYVKDHGDRYKDYYRAKAREWRKAHPDYYRERKAKQAQEAK